MTKFVRGLATIRRVSAAATTSATIASPMAATAARGTRNGARLRTANTTIARHAGKVSTPTRKVRASGAPARAKITVTTPAPQRAPIALTIDRITTAIAANGIVETATRTATRATRDTDQRGIVRATPTMRPTSI